MWKTNILDESQHALRERRDSSTFKEVFQAADVASGGTRAAIKSILMKDVIQDIEYFGKATRSNQFAHIKIEG